MSTNKKTVVDEMDDRLFMGVDCSTQSFKVTLINTQLQIVFQETLHFDTHLPHYNTHHGVITSEHKINEAKRSDSNAATPSVDDDGNGRDDLEAGAPSAMFVEAMDVVLSKLQSCVDVDVGRIVAISGSGQQHGSVYWRKGASKLLASMDPKLSMLENVRLASEHQSADSVKGEGLFACAIGPIWMDSSTTQQCKELETVVGGAQAMADLTGSRAYERFTGSQIKKIIDQKPQVYAECERISLISSMLPSLLMGRYAPIDNSDASGMNMMDISCNTWSTACLDAVTSGSSTVDAANLREKLGEVSLAHVVCGQVSTYLQSRYGFNSECRVIAFSGDNPCTLAGLQLQNPGDVAISLGTSDTLFAVIADPKPSGKEGHILRNPVDPRSYLGMLCYKNGSLTREKVRDASIQRLKTVDMGSKLNDPWSVFDRALEDTMIGNEGRVGFYYLEPEIIPTVNHTNLIRRFQIPSSDNGDSPLSLSSFPHPYDDIRACVEGAVISMRLHSASIGLGTQKGCQRVIVTGGGSVNKRILQIIADVFECDVYTSKSGPNAAALGACLRALHGYTMVYDADKDNGNGRDHGINDAGYDSNDLCNKYGKSFMPFHAILNPQSLSMSPPTPSPSNSLSLSSPTELVLQVSPTPSSYPVYRRMLMWYRSLECDIIKQFQ